MTAFFTSYAKIHAYAQNVKTVISARVIFFTNKNITYIYVQVKSLPKYTIQYIIPYVFKKV